MGARLQNISRYCQIRTTLCIHSFHKWSVKALQILHQNHSWYRRSTRTSWKCHSKQTYIRIIRITMLQRRKKTTSFTSKIRWFEHHQSSRYNKNWVHEFQNLNWNTHKSSKKSTKRLHPTFTSNIYPQWRKLQLRLVNL